METKVKALQPPNPSIVIRPAELNDLDELLRTCWEDRTRDVGRWLLSRVVRNRQERRGTGVVALGEMDQIIGYGQLTLWPRCGEISDLFVVEAYRSKGYGTAIIQHLMQQAVQFRASCIEIGAAENNPGAVSLYRRLGFVDHRVVEMNLGAADREPVIYMKIILGEKD